MSVMPPVGWDREGAPLHAGELAIQRRLGIDGKTDRAGRRSIRTYMPDQHREFFAQLPFMLVGAGILAGAGTDRHPAKISPTRCRAAQRSFPST